MSNLLRLLGSKTVIGTAAAVLGWLATLPVIDVKHVVGGLGVVVTSAGVRDALHQVTDAITANTAVTADTASTQGTTK